MASQRIIAFTFFRGEYRVCAAFEYFTYSSIVGIELLSHLAAQFGGIYISIETLKCLFETLSSELPISCNTH